MSSEAFSTAVARAVENGLAAAAVLDRDGHLVASAGALTEDDVRAIAGVVTQSLEGELASRLLAGDLFCFSVDNRDVRVGIAGRCVFVVAIFQRSTDADRARLLNRDVARIVGAMTDGALAGPLSGGGASGPPSGPAGLSVVEIGLTVGRARAERGKA